MAVKISQITMMKTVLDGAEEIEINDNGVTKKTTPQSISDFSPPDPYLEGLAFLYTAMVSGYGSNTFANQLGNWTGLSTVSGSAPAPTYSTLNKVTAIPRSVLRADSGAANDAGWGLGVSSGKRNSVLVPEVANDSGFSISIVGGIDVNSSSLSTTEVLFGAVFTSAALPAVAAAITLSAAAWLGGYSEN